MSEISDKQIAWKTQELGMAIHNLTANLLRIMAGAGRTVDLERQLEETNKLAKEIYGQSPVLSESTIVEALQISWPRSEGTTEDDRDFNSDYQMIDFIVQHSLRLAAAKITGNGSDASKNLTLLHRSLKQYESEQQWRRNRHRTQVTSK